MSLKALSLDMHTTENKSSIATPHIYRLLIEAVTDYAIFALDKEGYIVTWNPGAQNLKGYLPSEIIGKHFSTFYTQADKDRKYPQHELEVATAVGKFEDEGWRIRKDGSRFWASVFINRLNDENGNFIGFSKVTRNLSERKAAEIKLTESEERFRLLVSNIQDYEILTLSPEGNVMTWNLGAERIKGYRADEIIGRHFSVFYPQGDIDNGKPAMELRVAIEEGKFEDEGWRVRKDGSLFWANVIITTLRNSAGEVRGFAKITRDLTDKRQAEEVLRQSQERYRLLVDSVKDYAIILLDAKGRVTSWNQGAEKIKGYRAEEILGFHFSKFYPKEDLDAGKPEMELREATRLGSFEDEGWRLRKDGSRFWANVVITAVKDEAGNVRGFSKVTRDISDKRKADDKLKDLNESLEKKVALRTKELSFAIQTRDEFMSIASHELNTPLTTLKLHTQLRKRNLSKNGMAGFTEEKIQKMVEDDEKQINRLSRLVDDMLDITRLSSNKLSLHQESVNLCHLIRDISKRFELQMLDAKCEFTLETDCKKDGYWDAHRLEQVYINLLTNAIKYGAGKLIHVVVKSDDHFGKIIVTDKGRGIAPMDRERIFLQFERATPASEVSGLGIGLYIVKQIVDLHGGDIHVESELGKGSRFTVELPISSLPAT